MTTFTHGWIHLFPAFYSTKSRSGTSPPLSGSPGLPDQCLGSGDEFFWGDHQLLRWLTYPLVNVYKKLWKDPPCSMGKSAISMAMFNSELLNYQRVTPPYIQKNIFSINHDLKHTYKGILFIAYLVGGWPTPLKNMKVSWDDDIPNIWKNKTCLKPPTSRGYHAGNPREFISLFGKLLFWTVF